MEPLLCTLIPILESELPITDDDENIQQWGSLSRTYKILFDLQWDSDWE